MDEKFRAFVSTEEFRSAAGEQILSTKVLSQNSIKGRPFQEVAASLRPVWKEEGALILPKWKLSMPITEAKAFLFRITRGLVFKHYPQLHSPKALFHLEYVSDPNEVNPLIAVLSQRRPFMQVEKVGKEVFDYKHEATEEGSLWEYQFYGRANFMVLHSLRHHPLFD